MIIRLARGVWRRSVPQSARRYGQRYASALSLRQVRLALRAAESVVRTGPLIVSGLLSDAKGISAGGRLTFEGLKAAGLSPIAHDLSPLFSQGSIAEHSELPTQQPGGVWLLHVNAPEAVSAMARIHPDSWLGRYRIGFWAYELPRIPRSWVQASKVFHELWVPSRFVLEAMVASGVEIPIRVMPHPVALSERQAGKRDRARFKWDEGAFVVLAMGDLQSSATRKNLIGAIETFKLAFPSEHEAQLIIKTHSSKVDTDFSAAATRAAKGRSDIAFVPERLSQSDISVMIASCDVLLSPHRAEGFGLPLAEAFLAGVPSLATNWSGNLEFMSTLPELLIEARMTPVRDAYGIYNAPRLSWAEPNLLDAASRLRLLASTPELRQQLALRGKRAVQALSQAWSRSELETMPWWWLVGDSCSDAPTKV